MAGYGLNLKQHVTTRLEQRLVMTPQLQQAIKLLQLNHVELAEMLQEELLENPVLEVSEQAESTLDEPPKEQAAEAEGGEAEAATPEAGEAKEGEAAEAEAKEAAPEATPEVADPATEEAAEKDVDTALEDIDWEAYFQDTEMKVGTVPSVGRDFDPDLPPMESRLTPHTSLSQHLEWQLRLARISEGALQMAVLIIGHLDKHGWLVLEDQKDEDPLLLLARQMASEEALVTGEELTGEAREQRIEFWRKCGVEALAAIHEMDPAGVGARSLEECLLLQCRQNDYIEDPDLIDRLIRDHMKDLERKNYAAIGKKIKISLPELIESANIIGQLDPYPSRAFSSEPAAYITPDIYIKKVGDEYEISLNDDGLPKLKINGYYKQLLKDRSKEKEFIQEKLRNATWLLRSIHQRQQTIYKVTKSIVEKQGEFLAKGLQYLKPMILRDVAEDIEMHESTISRVTTNKYVHTPQGVFELKFFFTSSLQSSRGGEDVSSLTVKEKIKKMVSEEDPRSPLSDQQIVKMLGSEGIKIARRTVAKYRNTLGIAPSNRRKQPY